MFQLSQSALVKSAIAAAVGLGVVVSISACGAGQVSQTATQAAAVNGATVRLGALTLADVQIIYPGTTAPAEVFTNGGPFQIAFYISNNDPVNDTAPTSARRLRRPAAALSPQTPRPNSSFARTASWASAITR
mgnify:CR=1 FL=1